MQIGEVIRKHRKRLAMTQEEMADRLGVSAPAVNKWERGNSYPDISLLSPIARLLGITVDTLLSFHDELTAEEIQKIVYEVDAVLKEKPYEEAFQRAKKKLEQYPNCGQLSWQLAVIFDTWRMVQDLPDADKYDDCLYSWYARALESDDEMIRCRAAGSLFAFYMRKKQYEKAETYLEYFSIQNPERKRKQADIYKATDRIEDAYKTYEEILFEECQMMRVTLQEIYMLALQEQDRKKARVIARKQEELARCLDMGRYNEVSCRLEIATIEKDAETVIRTMQEMLSSTETIGDFRKSPLYEHMKFKEIRPEFLKEFKNSLLEDFQDEETFGFLMDDSRWKDLVEQT